MCVISRRQRAATPAWRSRVSLAVVPLLHLLLLHRLLQVAQRLAACAEFFEKVAMFLVGDGRALRADVDRPGSPVIVPWEEAIT